MSVQRWSAPAKLNLMLHIVGRRQDGYHELQTVFQLIDLCDRIDITVRDGRRDLPARRVRPGVPEDEDLVVRAARALQQVSGTRLGAEITIRKRIPMGGGLGGGSSDAATTLVALNQMWRWAILRQQISGLLAARWAQMSPFSWWGAPPGRRESAKSSPRSPWGPTPGTWSSFPGMAVPTAAVFQAPELTRNSPPTTMRGFLETGGRNDCEAVVRARFPAVGEALDWLGRHAPARLTGTGSCVFAKFSRAADAERVAARVPDSGAPGSRAGSILLHCWEELARCSKS